MIFALGFITGVAFMSGLRWVLYRLNKAALDIELKRLEDEQLLNQYKENGK